VCEGSWGAPGGSAIVAARRVIEPADNPGGKGDDPGPGSSLSWISAHPFIKREVCNLDLTIIIDTMVVNTPSVTQGTNSVRSP
jgi:hypothetical protein